MFWQSVRLVQCRVPVVERKCGKKGGGRRMGGGELGSEGRRTDATSTDRKIGADGSQAEVLLVSGDDEGGNDCAGEDK